MEWSILYFLPLLTKKKKDLPNLESLPNKNLHPIFFKPSTLIPLMGGDRGDVENKIKLTKQYQNRDKTTLHWKINKHLYIEIPV